MAEISKTKIECSFREIGNSCTEETKLGRYSQSMHWEVDGFGSSKWVVLGYIDLDWQKLINEDFLSERDIIERCLNHLNVAPERKKFQKKEPEPKFGKLEFYKADFKNKNGKSHIIVQFLTNQHNNDLFWGEGPLHSGVKIKKQKKEADVDNTQLAVNLD